MAENNNNSNNTGPRKNRYPANRKKPATVPVLLVDERILKGMEKQYIELDRQYGENKLATTSAEYALARFITAYLKTVKTSSTALGKLVDIPIVKISRFCVAHVLPEKENTKATSNGPVITIRDLLRYATVFGLPVSFLIGKSNHRCTQSLKSNTECSAVKDYINEETARKNRQMSHFFSFLSADVKKLIIECLITSYGFSLSQYVTWREAETKEQKQAVVNEIAANGKKITIMAKRKHSKKESCEDITEKEGKND